MARSIWFSVTTAPSAAWSRLALGIHAS